MNDGASQREAQPPKALELLDELLEVVSPRAWLALAAACLICAAALAWAVIGSVPTSVTGTGLLVRTGGVHEVIATGAGRVTRLLVKAGDEVTAGQTLVIMERQDLLQLVEDRRDRYADLQREADTRAVLLDKELQATRHARDRDIAAARTEAVSAAKRLEWMTSRVEALRPLVERGLVTSGSIADLEHERDELRLALERANATIERTQAEELELEGARRRVVERDRVELDDAARDLAEAEQRLREATEVRTAVAGRVIEVTTDIGRVLAEGTKVLAVESTSEALEAVVFVAAVEGKRVAPGMELQLTPSTVTREEYGFIRCRVLTVSPYPVTTQGMAALLGNPSLAEALLAHGPLITVTADPLPDPSARSGLRWSSAKGRTVQLSTGTMCVAEIVVERRAPIQLVAPALRRLLGA